METKIIIKCCHICSTVMESERESQRCPKCKKSFLPLNYFGKIHQVYDDKYEDLYLNSHELDDEDLITGLYVLW